VRKMWRKGSSSYLELVLCTYYVNGEIVWRGHQRCFWGGCGEEWVCEEVLTGIDGHARPACILTHNPNPKLQRRNRIPTLFLECEFIRTREQGFFQLGKAKYKSYEKW